MLNLPNKLDSVINYFSIYFMQNSDPTSQPPNTTG